MNITCAIFDFDGTLFDSMPLWKGLKFEFFDNMGIILTEQDKKDFSGLFFVDALPLAKKRFALSESIDELYSMFWELLCQKYLDKALPKNDIIPFLQKLKSMNVKMGIATATGEEALIPLLKKYDMLHFFSSIYSTYTVGASKDNPKVYDTVLSELNCDKETTWIFEDALYAAKTAKQNGYNVVGIFDNSEPHQQELRDTVDLFINDYNEINL